jgi:DNA-binding transcriptional LysR family regulator
MDTRLLRYFVALADEQHFGRAAEKLGITPPTLTVQIQNLEHALGTKLFVRSGKKTSLSKAGQQFLVEAKATIRQAERAEQVGRGAGRGEIATITVSYVMAAAMSGMISDAIRSYTKQYPAVSFRLQRLETLQTLRALVAKDVDVGIVRAPVRYPPELAGFTFLTDPYWAVVPADHPLAKRKWLTLDDFTGQPFVAAVLETELGLRGNIAEISSPALPAVSDAPAGEIVSVLVLVGAGLGLSIASTPITRVAMPNVVYKPMRGLKEGGERVVVYRKTEESIAVKRFVETLRKLSRKT